MRNGWSNHVLISISGSETERFLNIVSFHGLVLYQVRRKPSGIEADVKAKDFLKLMKDDAFITKMKAKYPTLLANLPNSTDAKYVLEGYLFPATYNIHDDTTVESLAEEMLSTMDTYLSH